MLLLLFRPLGGGSGPTPPPPVVAQTPSGVRRRRRELIVNIRDVQSREDTAEFLKSQLRIRHPQSAFAEVDEKAQEQKLAEQRRREKEMREKARLEALRIEEEKRLKRIRDNNERAILLALIASELDDL